MYAARFTSLRTPLCIKVYPSLHTFMHQGLPLSAHLYASRLTLSAHLYASRLTPLSTPLCIKAYLSTPLCIKVYPSPHTFMHQGLPLSAHLYASKFTPFRTPLCIKVYPSPHTSMHQGLPSSDTCNHPYLTKHHTTIITLI